MASILFLHSPHSISLTPFEIVLNTFVKVCFLLKGDIAISVAGKKKSYKPFQHIDNVKENIAKLFHLSGVDSLVVKHRFRQVGFTPGKHNSKEIDCRETLERNDAVSNNLHVNVRFMMCRVYFSQRIKSDSNQPPLTLVCRSSFF